MEASSAEESGGYLDFSRLTPGEIGGCVCGAILVLSLFLPWFGTSDSNEFSVLQGASNGESVNAFEVFNIFQYALILAASAPFILSWIIARGHKLTWKPGEITMIAGIMAVVLILCNGVILGRPADHDSDSSVEISLQIGYFVALLASFGLALSGFLRQSRYTSDRKPPGVI